ncbi:MAG: GYF domain-containing protein, partial [Planctomycetota bacterium]
MTAYYVRLKGKVWGPFSFDHLKSMQGQGRLSAFHEVSQDRVTWTPVSSVPELAPPKPAPPPPVLAEAVAVHRAVPVAAQPRHNTYDDPEPAAPA